MSDTFYASFRTLATGEIVLQWSEQKPQIVCNACPNQPVWCTHIEYAFKNRYELPIIWPEDFDISMPFLLPIFPSSNQFTNILLVPDGDGIKMIKWLDAPLNIDMAVGTIQKGEGLMTVRALMVEHMILQFALAGISKPECKASHHGLSAETYWQRRIQKDISRPSEFWSVFTTGSCLFCRNHDPSENDSDLVPASESAWT